MRKVFKVSIVIVAVLIIIGAVLMSIVVFDLAANFATGSEMISATGVPVGNALVVYDPGLSGAAKTVADNVAQNLALNNYTVTLAGIKSNAVSNVTGYGIIVVGGPVYGGTPTSSVKDFLTSLGTTQGFILGVFGSGQGSTTPLDVNQIKNAIADLPNGSSLSNATVVKIGQREDINLRTANFVTALIEQSPD